MGKLRPKDVGSLARFHFKVLERGPARPRSLSSELKLVSVLSCSLMGLGAPWVSPCPGPRPPGLEKCVWFGGESVTIRDSYLLSWSSWPKGKCSVIQRAMSRKAGVIGKSSELGSLHSKTVLQCGH